MPIATFYHKTKINITNDSKGKSVFEYLKLGVKSVNIKDKFTISINENSGEFELQSIQSGSLGVIKIREYTVEYDGFSSNYSRNIRNAIENNSIISVGLRASNKKSEEEILPSDQIEIEIDELCSREEFDELKRQFYNKEFINSLKLAKIFLLLGKLRESKEILNEIEDEVEDRYLLAILFEKLGEIAKYEEHIEKSSNEGNSSSSFNYAQYCLEKKEFSKSRQYFKKHYINDVKNDTSGLKYKLKKIDELEYEHIYSNLENHIENSTLEEKYNGIRIAIELDKILDGKLEKIMEDLIHADYKDIKYLYSKYLSSSKIDNSEKIYDLLLDSCLKENKFAMLDIIKYITKHKSSKAIKVYQYLTKTCVIEWIDNDSEKKGNIKYENNTFFILLGCFTLLGIFEEKDIKRGTQFLNYGYKLTKYFSEIDLIIRILKNSNIDDLDFNNYVEQIEKRRNIEYHKASMAHYEDNKHLFEEDSSTSDEDKFWFI